MNEIQDLIEKTINPPGMLKKNRRALFLAIRDIAMLVKKDALTAFNAHFPYLADSKKLTVRYKIIEEFLKVHLKVADLTDEERAWALELLDSLLNPNIYAELSEWFHYIEEVMLADSALYNYERQDIDFFEEKILRDGRILRDGNTVFNKTIKVLRDGVFKRNGRYGRSGIYTFPGTDILRLPLARGSGYRDSLTPTVKKPLADIQLGAPPRDGTHPRNGVFPRGWPTAFETMPPFDFFNAETETLPSNDRYPTVMKKPMSDTHVNSVKRDGSRLRDGMLQRASLLDTAEMNYTTSAVKETAQYRVFRNGMAKRDGTASRSGFGSSAMYENGVAAVKLPVNKEIEEAQDAAFQMAYKNNSDDLFKHTRKRDGALPRDGVTRRSNYIIDVYIFKYAAAAFQEDATMDEEFTVGMRKHQRRDGRHLRDGSMLRDSMMLLPL